MTESSKTYVGENYLDVIEKFKEYGFTNIKTVKITDKGLLTKNGQTLNILIDNKDGFAMGDWYAIDAEICIEYYEPETEEEVAAAHPGQLRIPNSSKYYLGKNYQEVANELKEKGFSQIELEKQLKDKKAWLTKDGAVSRISINGQTQFDKGEWFDEKSIIHIVYQTFSSEK